jgi:hypothetical protein
LRKLNSFFLNTNKLIGKKKYVVSFPFFVDSIFFLSDEVHLVEIPVRPVLFYQVLTDEQAVAFQKALLLMRSCCNFGELDFDE